MTTRWRHWTDCVSASAIKCMGIRRKKESTSSVGDQREADKKRQKQTADGAHGLPQEYCQQVNSKITAINTSKLGNRKLQCLDVSLFVVKIRGNVRQPIMAVLHNIQVHSLLHWYKLVSVCPIDQLERVTVPQKLTRCFSQYFGKQRYRFILRCRVEPLLPHDRTKSFRYTTNSLLPRIVADVLKNWVAQVAPPKRSRCKRGKKPKLV